MNIKYTYIYICYFLAHLFAANELHLPTQVDHTKIYIAKNMQLLLSFPGRRMTKSATNDVMDFWKKHTQLSMMLMDVCQIDSGCCSIFTVVLWIFMNDFQFCSKNTSCILAMAPRPTLYLCWSIPTCTTAAKIWVDRIKFRIDGFLWWKRDLSLRNMLRQYQYQYCNIFKLLKLKNIKLSIVVL